MLGAGGRPSRRCSKELTALDEGHRESSGSWARLLRERARRGMRAPRLAVGDGALGFWKALREVFPETEEQRCWVHKTANVLDSLPPIEPTFSTVRLRTKVTRGAGSRAAALAMTFKLIESARQRRLSVNAPHLVALVRAGARSERGVLVGRDEVAAA